MSARTLVLDLVPEEPAVFSRSAGTGGGHATHIAPTGASLLGWAARRLWTSFGDARAADIFLSGRLRFSDAVHVAGDAPLFPQPAILLAPKHGTGEACLGRAAFHALYDADQNQPKVQADRPSLGLFTLDGRHRKRPETSQRLRTATEAGRAKAGSLFGYRAVTPAGATLRATIEADPGAVSDAEWEALCGAFTGRLFLGRAAANGYGGAYRCTVGGMSPWPAGFEGEAAQLRIWFLTDAVLADSLDNPHIRPGPADFGLDDSWEVDGSETAVTSRRVWPWNRVLGCRDMEMPVVEAGSVVTLVRKAGLVRVAVPPVIGLHRERGWGRIAVIAGAFAVAPLEAEASAAPARATTEDSPLVKWAKARADSVAASKAEDLASQQLVSKVVGFVRQLGDEGPSPSQWSLVEDAARGALPIENALQQDVWRNGKVETDKDFEPIGQWVRREILKAPLSPAAKLRVIQAARAAAQGARR